MFNAEQGNVRAYAVAGSFDDCHRLTRDAFGDVALRRRVRLTSANSVNIGRLLPQMVYYFHAVAEVGRARGAADLVVCTPSGNFGNLTAGLMAKRAGLPIARFVAATNVNDVVPVYLSSGVFEPRPSVPTIANAMDVGNPSNFERMLWLYGNDRDAMRADIAASRHSDDDVRATIKNVYESRGYLLDPHSAIAYLGLTQYLNGEGRATRSGQAGVFLATAHPAKFGEIVEPIIGRRIEMPAPLVDALSRPPAILRMPATLEAVTAALRA
jgi:threonine synthase